MSDCYDRSVTSGAYVLGALSPAEAAEFEAALAESEELRAEVTGLADTAALLGLAATPVAPPADLKQSLLAALDATPQVAPEAAPPAPARRTAADLAAHPAAEAASAAAPAGERSTRRAHLAPRRARRRRALVAVAAVAAAVVLFAGGALSAGILRAVSDQRTADQFAALNAAADVVRFSTPLPEGGSASVVASEELGMSAVVLNDAADLPEGKTFQLWYVGEDGPESAGTVEPAGSSVYRMLEGDYDGEPIAMTVEPDGGSAAPTTDPMVLS
ncbi:anti-sigma factor [Naasia sp. SYSU D00057]|uniref:anti-sigma factor n=1 Tax=Naasia sp. SYSU D00057 TaxID=2817380 RepID=UPI001B3103F8|nr:anti-sigma factor [Naasia sp. SYSU D00057]